MSPSASRCSATTVSATSSIASVASPPGASPTFTARLEAYRGAARRRRAPARQPRPPARAGARASGRADRDGGLVDRDVALGQPGQRELGHALLAGRRRDRCAARRRRGGGATRRATPRGRRARPGAPPGPGGRRCAYPGMSDASTAVPAAIASSSTMPNDSWPSAGAQNTVAALSRAAFSSSVIRPSHSTFGRAPVAQRLRLGTVARDPEDRVAVETGPRVEQHAETLARLVPAEEQHGRASAREPGPPWRTARGPHRWAARCTSRRAPPRPCGGRRRTRRCGS